MNPKGQKISGERYRADDGRVVVFDGFGSEWLCCEDPRCDLQVVRPGKVQCNGRYRKIRSCPEST